MNFIIGISSKKFEFYFTDGNSIMEFLEELKEARRAKFRNDFFDELERVGIQREQYFDPVESGIRSNLVKISNFTAKLFRLENFQ